MIVPPNYKAKRQVLHYFKLLTLILKLKSTQQPQKLLSYIIGPYLKMVQKIAPKMFKAAVFNSFLVEGAHSDEIGEIGR